MSEVGSTRALAPQIEADAQRSAFFSRALSLLTASHIPFLIGGAYALTWYTGIERLTKDLDVFVRRRDCSRILEALSTAGWQTELTYPHWLAKAYCGDEFIDVIFGSGNGITEVDEEWFTHASEGEIFGRSVRLCPAEESIWARAFVMERERYDGADIAHMILARGPQLDWARILRRFGPHWRVLLGHLVLFGFIYPTRRTRVPEWVMRELLGRLQCEIREPARGEGICQGTLLSRAEYLMEVERWGYQDARRLPQGNMTTEEIARWTAAIGEGQACDANGEGHRAADCHR